MLIEVSREKREGEKQNGRIKSKLICLGLEMQAGLSQFVLVGLRRLGHYPKKN